MNILIDIGHPAHVHYYRNTANELVKKGHKLVWSVKDIPVARHLLEYYGFSYTFFPKKADSLAGKAFRQLQHNFLLLMLCRRERIDIAIGTSVAAAHVSKISKVRSIVFDDDDDNVQPLVTKYVNPFADALLTPSALDGKRKRRDTIYYNGYHELMYLHPNRFNPDITMIEELGLQPSEPYFVMRFNVFKAHHDIGIKGLSLEQKLKLIEILKPFGKIFITTERNIESELKEFQLKIHPSKIHSLIYFANIFLGDSQTMTSEAAVLGVPSLRCNTFAGRLSTLEEQEKKYDLSYAFHPDDFDLMILRLKEILSIENIKESWRRKRDAMLNDMIDVTAFMVWFIENYPESAMIMKSNPDYQFKFKL